MKMKFQTKLVLMIFVLVVVISSWLTFQNLNAVESMFKEEMKEIGYTLAESVDDK